MEPPSHPDLETVPCNLCQGTKTRTFTRRKGMHVVQCRQCGLVYVSPRLTAASLARHYNSGQSSRIQYYLDVECADRRTFAGVLDLAAEFAPPPGSLLDIGPNIGTCLALARDRGWDAYGIEINAEAADYCRRERGLNVRAGVLDADTYPRNSFDVVLMGDVIEHLPDPRATMRIVQGILKPGGVVLISTPNIAGWAGRALQIKPEEHIYYFAPATMQAMLRQVSLEVVTIRALDRYHNVTAMTHSTTFGGLFPRLAPAFRLAHRVLGDLVIRLPLRENLLAVARKPAQVLAEVA
jgi:2-polyprenyl-3-methyl-5-hydroxy-6-metoxy-1,4-benzoquinol methylase